MIYALVLIFCEFTTLDSNALMTSFSCMWSLVNNREVHEGEGGLTMPCAVTWAYSFSFTMEWFSKLLSTPWPFLPLVCTSAHPRLGLDI